MTKVELIHPAHPASTDDRLDPPLGLLLIAAHLRKTLDCEVRVTDLSGTNKFAIGWADMYGMTSYATSMKATAAIAAACRKINPTCKFVVGGANPSAIPDAYGFADHVVIGEGEDAMVDIVRGTSERLVRVRRRASVNAYPAYDLIDPNSYHRRICGQRTLPVLTTRGCPYDCAFCGLHTMHKLTGVRYGGVSSVAWNIERLCREYGLRAINIQDDMFTLDRWRLFRLLDRIKPLNIKFRCMGRAGYDTEEVYAKLAEAGCVQVAWGIESGSQYVLDRMRKRVTVADNRNVIAWAKKYGIVSRAFFIFGFPGETEDTLKETMAFIDAADPDQYFVSNFIPFPGTPVWREPARFGITKMSGDYDQYYQVSQDGSGGVTIATEWLSMERFKELELRFRKWLGGRRMRGDLLDYEKKLYTQPGDK